MNFLKDTCKFKFMPGIEPESPVQKAGVIASKPTVPTLRISADIYLAYRINV